MSPNALMGTPEMLAKSREARRLRNAARRASPLRRDFSPEEIAAWQEMASANKLRLPPWGEPYTSSLARTWLHKLGLFQVDYEEHFGKGALDHFVVHNPDWPARAWVGLLLEAFCPEGRADLAGRLAVVARVKRVAT